MLQYLHRTRGPLLGCPQHAHVSLVLGSPALNAALRARLASAEQRGRITSLDLLATLFAAQPRRLLRASK